MLCQPGQDLREFQRVEVFAIHGFLEEPECEDLGQLSPGHPGLESREDDRQEPIEDGYQVRSAEVVGYVAHDDLAAYDLYS